MNNQIEYIGRKIKELSGDKFQRIKTPIGEENFYNPLFNEVDFPNISEENLFIHIGEFLISQDVKHKNNLISFVEVLGHKLIKSKAALDQSINFVYLTRCSIMDVLELEIHEKRISIDSFFEVIKIIEYLYQLISKTLLNIYNEELSFIKHALDESKEDLKMTLRELADLERVLNEATIFAITGREDNILYANDNFCNLYKYTREELVGRKHDIYSSNFHPPSFFNEIWETIQGGEVWKGDILNQAKDGTKYWLDTTIIPFVDSNGERYKHISIQYDITEKRNAEEALRKTEKLAMIGELAAGIAHEIRNPLTTIRGFVQLLKNDGLDPHYANTFLDEIDRINFIVSEFMVFARPHQIYFSDCNIKSILTSVINFLEPEAILKNVYIEYKFPIEEIVISGEKNQLKQVFLNLLKNSIEAMPNGGKIYILIERTAQDISITIKDEGIGMETDQVKKLGEPFFTTKQDGNGLGLMVSYKIIQNHKGTIQVNSQLNQGTTFIISFRSPTKTKN
ncbi:PAS domain S-box-containing protein [Bacillus oleivorans]|uniref:histidine kinase n=1 Tax=Bacillus oleivorans TaxID=1448271 RepID=A0A285CU32_9BACI|nr:ATP-binding protein [Bacillus oleivorans]SNX70463.1 PAS domain S-box-containing protein [Bacillus oleivorans]